MSRNRAGERRRNSRQRRARKEQILRRDGGACLRCGSTDNLTIDHIHPLAKGGHDGDDNLQTLCFACNQAKGDRSVSYQPWEPGDVAESA